MGESSGAEPGANVEIATGTSGGSTAAVCTLGSFACLADGLGAAFFVASRIAGSRGGAAPGDEPAARTDTVGRAVTGTDADVDVDVGDDGDDGDDGASAVTGGTYATRAAVSTTGVAATGRATASVGEGDATGSTFDFRGGSSTRPWETPGLDLGVGSPSFELIARGAFNRGIRSPSSLDCERGRGATVAAEIEPSGKDGEANARGEAPGKGDGGPGGGEIAARFATPP
jgi:hypothetical protein